MLISFLFSSYSRTSLRRSKVALLGGSVLALSSGCQVQSSTVLNRMDASAVPDAGSDSASPDATILVDSGLALDALITNSDGGARRPNQWGYVEGNGIVRLDANTFGGNYVNIPIAATLVALGVGIARPLDPVANIRLGLYRSNEENEPTTLIAEASGALVATAISEITYTGTSYDVVELPVPEMTLDAGGYWLILSIDQPVELRTYTAANWNGFDELEYSSLSGMPEDIRAVPGLNLEVDTERFNSQTLTLYFATVPLP